MFLLLLATAYLYGRCGYLHMKMNSDSSISNDKIHSEATNKLHVTMSPGSSTSDEKSRSDANNKPLINTTTVVGFTVLLSETKTYSSTGSNIVWDRVVDNSGRSYDLSTGRVTAPFTGRYYFAVTTLSPNRYRAHADIMVDGVMLCRVTSAVLNEVGSCQGIRHMAAGDQAWVQAYNGTNTFKANASSFTGFLLAGAGDVSRVSFTVRMTSNKQSRNERDKLIWDQAMDNHGRSMNLTTGTFTAPATGQYFFALTTSSSVDQRGACANIIAGGVTICRVCTCKSSGCRSLGSCLATARLAAGRKAWVETFYGDQHFIAEVTTFSGALVSGNHDTAVGFTATLTRVRIYNADGERVVLDRTTDNMGGGYDNNTGQFTAPVAGRYFFALNTELKDGDVDVVTSEGQTVCRVDSGVYRDSGSCQGVVRLNRGQQVWVETLHCPCYFQDMFSVFSGFLIQPATL